MRHTPNMMVYTLGQPRTSDDAFAPLYHAMVPPWCHFRLANHGDVVPLLPTRSPMYRYKHVGTLVVCTRRHVDPDADLTTSVAVAAPIAATGAATRATTATTVSSGAAAGAARRAGDDPSPVEATPGAYDADDEEFEVEAGNGDGDGAARSGDSDGDDVPDVVRGDDDGDGGGVDDDGDGGGGDGHDGGDASVFAGASATAGVPLFIIGPAAHERKAPPKAWFDGAAPHVNYVGAVFPKNPLQRHNK